MTIKLTIKNDDTRETAVVAVERLFEAGNTELVGEIKGGESVEVWVHNGVTVVVNEIQNG